MRNRCGFERQAERVLLGRGHQILGHTLLRLAALLLKGDISASAPEWRNGRRNGLKIRRGQPHESSTLSSGIRQKIVSQHTVPELERFGNTKTATEVRIRSTFLRILM